MQAATTPIVRDIVLIGGGHSHVVVLRRFAMQPLPGVRLTVICTDTDTPYSGMLPGYIAGHYDFDAVHIDLRRLAEFAGARYFRDEVVGIDRSARRCCAVHAAALPYDLLSINIGSTPQLARVPGAAEHAVPVKPIRRFNERWLALLARVQAHAGTTTIAVVGAGAGGVELTLAMQYRLRGELAALGRDPDELRFHLFSADTTILPTHNAGGSRRLRARAGRAPGGGPPRRGSGRRRRWLAAGAQRRHAGRRRDRLGDAGRRCAVAARHRSGARWPGFHPRPRHAAERERSADLRRRRLRISDRPAAGKGRGLRCAHGQPLAANLRRSLLRQPLLSYRPQRRWLALISTGDRHAVASRGWLFARGEWVWRWKDWIDRRFMRRFCELAPMAEGAAPPAAVIPLDEAEQTQAISAIAMRCGGCGAKVGATVLSRALANIHPITRDDVLIGLHAPDDAAVLRVPPGSALVHSVDFFRAFIDDPWLFGQIAANHALGDIFAMGGAPQSATAIATIPPGLESKVEDTVFQMMAGAVAVLNDAGCALVGGHTGEGRELALGFAINGLIDEERCSASCARAACGRATR
jgi:selenide,water dikinase